MTDPILISSNSVDWNKAQSKLDDFELVEEFERIAISENPPTEAISVLDFLMKETKSVARTTESGNSRKGWN